MNPKIKTFPTVQPLHAINGKLMEAEDDETAKELNLVFKFMFDNYERFTFGQFAQMCQFSPAELVHKKHIFDKLVKHLQKEQKIIVADSWDEIIYKKI